MKDFFDSRRQTIIRTDILSLILIVLLIVHTVFVRHKIVFRCVCKKRLQIFMITGDKIERTAVHKYAPFGQSRS